MNSYETFAVFLVVPQLSTPLILGTDWLLENGVNIDYSKKEVSLPSLESNIPFKLIVDDNPNSVANSLKRISIDEEFPLLPDPPINFNTQIDIPFESEKTITMNDVQLDTAQQKQMSSVLEQYQFIFQEQPGIHKFFSYKFNVKPHEPYKVKPYPVPFSRRAAVQSEINKMIEWGVIERSDSPYNNPLVTVIKSDGSIRLCLDARKLNTLILPTRDASPPIDEILAKFHSKSYFSTLDFASGYWQIPFDASVR